MLTLRRNLDFIPDPDFACQDEEIFMMDDLARSQELAPRCGYRVSYRELLFPDSLDRNCCLVSHFLKTVADSGALRLLPPDQSRSRNDNPDDVFARSRATKQCQFSNDAVRFAHRIYETPYLGQALGYSCALGFTDADLCYSPWPNHTPAIVVGRRIHGQPSSR